MPMSFEMPELLIYIVPAFAGIIGSRYLSRLANFCVMVVIFQFDLAILFGQFRAAVFTPYTVICLIPALAGIVGDRYLSKCKYDLQIGRWPELSAIDTSVNANTISRSAADTFSSASSPMRFSLSGSSMSAACCWHTTTVEDSYRCYFSKRSSYPRAAWCRRWSSSWLR